MKGDIIRKGKTNLINWNYLQNWIPLKGALAGGHICTLCGRGTQGQRKRSLSQTPAKDGGYQSLLLGAIVLIGMKYEL